jgi:hypothetical protein
MLERSWEGSRAGTVLTKANGVLEGASRGLKVLGVVGTVAAVGYDIYDIATAPPAQRKRVAAEHIGELAGGIAGAAAGAAIGGPIGAMVGGYLGSVAGKAMGSGLARLFHW